MGWPSIAVPLGLAHFPTQTMEKLKQVGWWILPISCLIHGQYPTVYIHFSTNILFIDLCIINECLQPHHIECTSTRLITEVKQYWAELVL